MRLYQAPEVLVGQPESNKSYSWTMGVIIDRLFHGRLFYQKFGDILDHKGTEMDMQTATNSRTGSAEIWGR